MVRKRYSQVTSLCTFNGGLPQGSPASPKLANLVAFVLDCRLSGYAGSKGIVYTRYADDLTFSANSYAAIFSAFYIIKEIIKSEGFLLNTTKTRIAGPARRRSVTGLVVGPENIGIGRQRLRDLRVRIHKLCNTPDSSAPHDQVASINGWLAFVHGVDESRINILNNYLEKLQMKYPDSAVKFLRIPR